MGQKVSPIGFRTGITRGWKSRWFAPKSNFGEFLVEDYKIRQFVDQRLNRQPPHAAISSIEIERTREEVKVILHTARPGLVIGPKGAEVDKLKAALEDLTDRRVNINIVEIKNPDIDAQLIAEGIAEQLKRRASFRRTIKQRTQSAMQAGAKGVKIMISGRLNGAEMSRSEMQLLGSIPLHTLQADIDYGFAPSFTSYGIIGVKVWVHRGMFGDKPPEPDRSAGPGGRRGRDGGGGRGGRSGFGPRAGGANRGPGTGTRSAAPASSSAPSETKPEAPKVPDVDKAPPSSPPAAEAPTETKD